MVPADPQEGGGNPAVAGFRMGALGRENVSGARRGGRYSLRARQRSPLWAISWRLRGCWGEVVEVLAAM